MPKGNAAENSEDAGALPPKAVTGGSSSTFGNEKDVPAQMPGTFSTKAKTERNTLTLAAGAETETTKGPSLANQSIDSEMNASNNVPENDMEAAALSNQTHEDVETGSPAAVSDAYVVEPKTSKTSQVIDAIQVEEVDDQDSKTLVQQYGAIFAFLGVMLVAILVAVLTNREKVEDRVFLITPSSTPVATAEFATLAPTASPTTFLESGQPFAPTSARFADVVQEILLQFESPTLEVAILNPSSPQHRAALWMTEIDAHNSTASLSFPLNDTDSMLEFRQRYALVTLYYSTGGEQWVDRCNFVSANLHVCGWQCPFPDGDAGDTADLWLNFQYMGVTCFDTIGGDPGSSVIAVEIAFNGLSGTLPDELQGHDYLFVLSLPWNSLVGSLPLETLSNTLFNRQSGQPPFLDILDVRSNQLQGTLSPSIGNFPFLSFVRVFNNLLTGTIPTEVGLLSDVREFLTSLNLFSGEIPTTLFSISGIVNVDLSSNIMTGNIPEFQSMLPTLSNLFLDEIFFTGTFPGSLGNAENLSFLVISNNGLTGAISSSLGDLAQLQSLFLRNNSLTGKVLEESFWYNMTSLQTLSMGDNPFSGTMPPEIMLLDSLTDLNIGHVEQLPTSFSATLPSERGLLTNLNSLFLSRNDFSGQIPTEIGNLSNLRSLGLNTNGFTGMIPSEMNLLTNLDLLAIQENQLTGSLEGYCGNGPTNIRRVSADCREESVQCSCCTECCNFAGRCEVN